MAAGVYTLAHGAVHDVTTAALAAVATLALTVPRVPPVAVVLAGGVAGWLLGL
jgi:chromate transport protein ChrA